MTRAAPLVDVTGLIRSLIKEAQRLQRLIEKLLWTMYKIENVLEQTGRLRPSAGRNPRRAHGASGERAPIVHHFHIDEDKTASHGIVLTLDDNKVTISRALKELIEILAADEGDSKDELVPWKSRDAVCEQLAKHPVHKFTRQALSQRVYLLRKALSVTIPRGGDLIETSAVLGLRLRRERGAPGALSIHTAASL